MRRISLLLLFGLIAAGPATAPDTDHADDSTVDWLLAHATTAPAEPSGQAPTTLPSILKPAESVRDESRQGTILLSDGKKLSGKISTTLRQPLRVWDADDKQYQDIPFSLITSIEARVVWERDEPEWKFKESGSDVKEYSGKTYPARLTEYIITQDDGTTVTGGVAAPIYLDSADGSDQKIFILHKRDKGDPGQRLGQLVYVKKVTFEK